MNVGALLKKLLAIGYPLPDGSGNLKAQIVPRTNTLADLLGVTDAGDGELASATDARALVQFNGDPSEGVAHQLNRSVARAVITLPSGSFSIPANVALAQITGLSAPIDDLSLFNGINDEWSVPSGVPHIAGDNIALRLDWWVNCSEATTGGVDFVIILERHRIAEDDWTTVVTYYGQTATLGVGGTFYHSNGMAQFIALADIANTDKFRLRAATLHATTGVSLSGMSIICDFVEYP